MADLGPPSSYLTLAKGASVYSSDGERLGEVEHVLADPEIDVFDGFVIDTSILPGGRRFVDASQVDEVYERGVVLNLDAAAAERLPKPSENPAALEAGPDDMGPEGLDDKLRRAWDLISGKG
ncbi:MAG TPA: PRC-barrel domain-containing protein [Solirubrobacterales bacterium]|jgi:hypothetical protein